MIDNDETIEDDLFIEESVDESGDEALGPEEQIHQIRLRKPLPGRRLDKFLTARYPRISRTTLQGFIKAGQVTVNGLPTKPSYEPRQGDVIKLVLPPPPPANIVPRDIPLNIVYEDQWLLVINKQPGIVCHPAWPGQTDTIANAAAFHAGNLSAGSEPFRPGILHRIDKNTTGLLLIAKTDEAHWRVSLQFERRTVRKQYLAVCEGEMAKSEGIIDKPLAPLAAAQQQAGFGAAPPRQAMYKEAITEYRVRSRYFGYTAVDLFPKTGRTHQLRVHLAMVGHPIVGDTRYGGRPVSEHDLTGSGSEEPFLSHQALHALRLRCVHPITEMPLELEAALPDYFQRLIDLLESHRKR